MAESFKNVRTVALTAVLIALAVVGNGLKIPLSMGLEIRFGFVFLSTIAFLFGPVVAFAAGFTSNLLAFLLFPSGFGYNVLFDLNIGLSGVLYAIFLYRKNYKSEYFVVWVAAAKIAVNFVCNIVINSYLLRAYLGPSADIITITRIFKNITLLPGEIVVMLFVLKYVAEAAKKYNFVKSGGGKKEGSST